MRIDLNEGTLAAQLRGLAEIEPRAVWQKVERASAVSLRTRRHRFRVFHHHRLVVALAVAAGLALLGGTAMAVSTWTRPAFVHGKPVTQSQQGGFAAHMGWPGHPIQVSVDEASRLTGFKVLTLDSTASATLNSVTYIPQVVAASQPAPMGGGSVSLDYTMDGVEVQINEGLDPNPSAPLVINQKIPPGYKGPLCTTVETIEGGQYIFMRCPDGQAIHGVMWKTLDGVDISLVPVIPSASGSKGNPPVMLSMSLVTMVIDHLR